MEGIPFAAFWIELSLVQDRVGWAEAPREEKSNNNSSVKFVFRVEKKQMTTNDAKLMTRPTFLYV